MHVQIHDFLPLRDSSHSMLFSHRTSLFILFLLPVMLLISHFPPSTKQMCILVNFNSGIPSLGKLCLTLTKSNSLTLIVSKHLVPLLYVAFTVVMLNLKGYLIKAYFSGYSISSVRAGTMSVLTHNCISRALHSTSIY